MGQSSHTTINLLFYLGAIYTFGLLFIDYFKGLRVKRLLSQGLIGAMPFEMATELNCPNIEKFIVSPSGDKIFHSPLTSTPCAWWKVEVTAESIVGKNPTARIATIECQPFLSVSEDSTKASLRISDFKTWVHVPYSKPVDNEEEISEELKTLYIKKISKFPKFQIFSKDEPFRNLRKNWVTESVILPNEQLMIIGKPNCLTEGILEFLDAQLALPSLAGQASRRLNLFLVAYSLFLPLLFFAIVAITCMYGS